MIWLMSLGYVALAGLLLTASIPTRFSMLIKLLGILLITSFYFATYLGHRGLAVSGSLSLEIRYSEGHH